MPSPRCKPKNEPPDAGLPAAFEREYRMLSLAVGEVERFVLITATCDDPRRCDELIDRLSAEQRAHRLLVSRLCLADSTGYVLLLKALRRHLAATDAPEGWRRAVMVTGLDRLLENRGSDPDADRLAVLYDANFQRDAFPRLCPVPIVVWLSPATTTLFARAAPDLWDWRVATFNFSGPGTAV